MQASYLEITMQPTNKAKGLCSFGVSKQLGAAGSTYGQISLQGDAVLCSIDRGTAQLAMQVPLQPVCEAQSCIVIAARPAEALQHLHRLALSATSGLPSMTSAVSAIEQASAQGSGSKTWPALGSECISC